MTILPLSKDWQKVLSEVMIRLGLISDDYTGPITLNIIKGKIVMAEKKEAVG